MFASSDKDVFLAAAACVAICCAGKKRVQSSFLVCPLLQSMSKYSSCEMLQDFELDDQDFFLFYFHSRQLQL